ncbi:hypothetical protein Rhe02_22930 [Rhizocola hellebori]|uniref:GGDEF domain-containing protein n=1 Tax=Rhizocola hellebori TaxID=1392758 RepID=A0A8J3VFI5_9ACTN|nr:GGDEF domain-containing protein [Rhizocola hellebori]GIH04226.1 hypothetical protein Rhe02_22930 [Rhizocola hellebori]
MAQREPSNSYAVPATIVTAYAVLSAAAALIYLVVSPAWRGVIFMAAAWAAFLWAIAAVRRVPLPQGLPFVLLAAALLLGNAAWLIRVLGVQPEPVSPPLALTAAAGNALLLAAAMIVVFRRGSHDLGGLLEVVIFSVGVGGLLCLTVILPAQRDNPTSPASRMFVAVNIVLLFGVVGALMRLWTTAGAYQRALGILLVAVGFALAGNCVLAISGPQALFGAYWCFIGAYTAIGLFCAGSSVGEIITPGLEPDDHLSLPRLVLLGLALAAMPVAAAVPAVSRHPASTVLVAICGCLIAALVMLRIGLLAQQRRRAMVQLRHLADHDPLTGALNRRAFAQRLSATVSSGPCVLAFCDIDRFKDFNDRHGHAAGDEVLVRITERIMSRLSGGDFVGRIGGDEFVVCAVLPPEAAPALQARLEEVLAEPMTVAGHDIEVTVSVGVASSHGAASAAELLNLADKRMYANKNHRPGDPGPRPS